MEANHNTHIIRIAVVLIVAIGLGLVAKKLFTPKGFGEYGHYRAAAVLDERALPARNMTNDSCLTCHPYIREMHLSDKHKTVSCEFCHGPYADHILADNKIVPLPVKKGAEIRTLCLRCHNRIIRARPEESIKMISLPAHLEDKHVNPDHICDQCHNVHAPTMYIRQARAMMGFPEESL